MTAARKGPRTTTLVTGGVLGLAAVVILILWATAPRQSAEDAVQEYLDAVAAGDVQLANDLVPETTDSELPATVDARTPEAVAGWTPITEAQVLDVLDLADPEETGARVHVEVSYAVGDSTYTTGLTVEREESDRLFAEQWQVRTPLSVDFPVTGLPGLAYTIGDQPLTVGSDDRIALYPGSYPVAIEGGTYLAEQEYTLDVAPREAADPGRIRVVPEPTPALAEELTAHVADAVERCTVRDEPYITQCQLWANREGDQIAFDPVTWTVTEAPTVEETNGRVVEVLTHLQAEYEVADDLNSPRSSVTEQVVLLTELVLRIESPDAYEIFEVNWHTF